MKEYRIRPYGGGYAIETPDFDGDYYVIAFCYELIEAETIVDTMNGAVEEAMYLID